MGLFDEWQGFDVQEERRIGEEKGSEKRLIDQACKKLQKGKLPSIIAEELEEDDISHIQQICDIAVKYAPDYDPEEIYNELSKNKDLVNN